MGKHASKTHWGGQKFRLHVSLDSDDIETFYTPTASERGSDVDDQSQSSTPYIVNLNDDDDDRRHVHNYVATERLSRGGRRDSSRRGSSESPHGSSSSSRQQSPENGSAASSRAVSLLRSTLRQSQPPLVVRSKPYTRPSSPDASGSTSPSILPNRSFRQRPVTPPPLADDDMEVDAHSGLPDPLIVATSDQEARAPVQNLELETPKPPQWDDLPIVGATNSTIEPLLAEVGLALLEITHTMSFPIPRIIACKECRMGVTEKQAITHPQNNHGIPIAPNQRKKLKSAIADTGVLSSCQEVPTRRAGEAPIPGIAIKEGLKCHLCQYACPKPSTMGTHFSTNHPGIGAMAKNSSAASIQTLFAFSCIYFVVLPTLSGVAAGDTWKLIVEGPLRAMNRSDVLSLPYDPSNEITPLLRMTRWNDFITDDRLKSRNSLDAVRSLTKPPIGVLAKTETFGNRLRLVIVAYMEEARRLGRGATLGVRSLLMECPR